MNKVQEALKAAIDELERVQSIMLRECGIGVVNVKVTEYCKSALSDIEKREPVAYIHRNEYDEYRLEPMDSFKITSIPRDTDIPLYTSPISKEWVGLSESDVHSLVVEQNNSRLIKYFFLEDLQNLADAISAKLKQLNAEKG